MTTNRDRIVSGFVSGLLLVAITAALWIHGGDSPIGAVVFTVIVGVFITLIPVVVIGLIAAPFVAVNEARRKRGWEQAGRERERIKAEAVAAATAALSTPEARELSRRADELLREYREDEEIRRQEEMQAALHTKSDEAEQSSLRTFVQGLFHMTDKERDAYIEMTDKERDAYIEMKTAEQMAQSKEQLKRMSDERLERDKAEERQRTYLKAVRELNASMGTPISDADQAEIACYKASGEPIFTSHEKACDEARQSGSPWALWHEDLDSAEELEPGVVECCFCEEAGPNANAILRLELRVTPHAELTWDCVFPDGADNERATIAAFVREIPTLLRTIHGSRFISAPRYEDRAGLGVIRATIHDQGKTETEYYHASMVLAAEDRGLKVRLRSHRDLVSQWQAAQAIPPS